MKGKGKILAGFILTMVALGASDSLKGVFAPVFRSHFALSNARLSWIMTAGYLGNLLFLLVGGRLADRYPGKRSLVVMISLWLAALLVFALTDDFALLLVGVFVAMGSSTLINTTINIVTPAVFAASPGFFVNFLFFTQGIGTSGSQALVGRFGTDFFSWKIANAALFALGLAGLAFVCLGKIPDRRKDARAENHESRAVPPSNGAIRAQGALTASFFVLIFGLYFVAEHGVLNWLVAYATSALSLSTGTAANYLAVFFAGITIGRLVFAPLVDRFGTMRTIGAFSALSAALYAAGFLCGSGALALLSVSGFTLSIVYPTLVMAIRLFFPPDSISGVTGAILSVASLFDIAFNLLFGNLADRIGFARCVKILPAAMVAYAVLFIAFAMYMSTRHKEAIS